MSDSKYLYDNGLPFSSILAQNIDKLLLRIYHKKVAVILIEGGLGEGKTTLITHILDYVNKKSGLPELALDKTEPQLAVGGLQFLRKLRVCISLKLPAEGYDEAGDFSKRGALTGFNAMLNRVLDIFRAFKILVVIGLPTFDSLDMPVFDKHVPRLLLRCHDREAGFGNFAAYSLYRMVLLKAKMKQYKDLKNFAYTKIVPNFRGHFLDLPPERAAKLEVISTREKFDILKASEIKIEGLMTGLDMATKLMKSLHWVRVAIRNLKIKPERTIKNLNYYSKDCFNRLCELNEELGERPRGPQKGEGGRPVLHRKSSKSNIHNKSQKSIKRRRG